MLSVLEFFKEGGNYDLDFKSSPNDGSKVLSGPKLAELYADLANKYPIISIEDPFEQDDWENYVDFVKAVGKDVQVVGDDLLVTNVKRIETAAAKKACNALLLKVRQAT